MVQYSMYINCLGLIIIPEWTNLLKHKKIFEILIIFYYECNQSISI